MRFDFFYLLRINLLDAFNLVGKTVLKYLLQLQQFSFFGGDDNLAANLMGDVVFFCEGGKGFASGCAGSCLYRARFVIEARVNDARVVAGLVRGNLLLFFEDSQSDVRIALRDLICGCQTDYPGAQSLAEDLVSGRLPGLNP